MNPFFAIRLKSITRGKVNVNIDVKKVFKNSALSTNVNLSKAQDIFAKLEEVKKRFSIEDKINIEHLLHFPEIFEEDPEDYNNDSFKSLLLNTLNDSITELINMKTVEGTHLKKDIVKRLSIIEKATKKVKSKSKDNVRNEFDKHLKRIEELLENKKIELERLEQEVAIIADKVDITEEITRLESHLKHFKDVIKKEQEIGKKLTFILQEMNREANTINNKATETDINYNIILIKQEIEKIREQVQNIE